MGCKKLNSIASKNLNNSCEIDDCEEDEEEEMENEYQLGCPFKIEWNFGFNPEIQLLNISLSSDVRRFVNASDHILQIFHLDDNHLECFVGHESEIFVVTTESTGRFIVSADISGVVNIWDLNVTREFPYPIRSIYQPYNQQKLSKLALSFDGKFLVMASGGKKSLVKLWQWSSVTSKDEDIPRYSFEVAENFIDVKDVKFNCNSECLDTFILTFSNGVLFAKWDESSQSIKRHSPARAISITFNFIESCFIENSSKAMSVTDSGSVVVWNSSEGRHQYQKELLKSVKITDNALRVIKFVDGFVVIADSMGHIRFYDEELKIAFWCPSHESIDSIVTISFDLHPKVITTDVDNDDNNNNHKIQVRNFFIQSKSEIYAVDVSQMRFERTFYKSDDFITAIDLHPKSRNLLCAANYSGRIFLYNFQTKKQIVENQLKLQRRKSPTSDTEIIEIPHVTCVTFSNEGHDLMCGLENGLVIILDPNVLNEISSLRISTTTLLDIKFSPDSTFVVIYDDCSMVIVLHRDISEASGWSVVGKLTFHSKPICDVLFIPRLSSVQRTSARLISLAQDRHILEYDLLESAKNKETNGLVTSFNKRIFQSLYPVSMTLIHNRRLGDDQLLITDNEMKFRIFDKNTFEILSTFHGPIYDSHVRQIHSNLSNQRLTSKLLVFSTNKNICVYSLPLDGNPYRSLGVIGHSNGIRKFKVDTKNQRVFTIGNKCQSVVLWKINHHALNEHLNEGGNGLQPYCDLLPGGKFGLLLQNMQDLYYYMLLMSNNNFIDDRVVRDGLEINDVPDFMRGLGYFPSDYEIECILHELSVRGRRRIPFEDLVKLFINHSHPNASRSFLEKSLKQSLEINEDPSISSHQIIVKKSQLLTVLTDSAEKMKEKDAEIQLKEIFCREDGKLAEEVTLQDLLSIFSSPNCNVGLMKSFNEY